MIRIVADTNVAVSAVLKPQGAEAAVFVAVAAGKLLLCVSEPILAEYQEVLVRPRLRLEPLKVRAFLQSVRAVSMLVTPAETLSVSRDEPDNRFLECAEAASADYLITGNLRHFPREWKETKVVTARQFADLGVSR